MNRFLVHASRVLLASAACAMLANAAFATTRGMRDAIETVDLPKLEAEAASGTAIEKEIAAAVKLGWRHQDAAAVDAFNKIIPRIPDARLKTAAMWALSAVQSRMGDFAGSVKTGETARAILKPTADAAQSLAFMKALVGVAPTRAMGTPAGRVEIRRDPAGLMRSDIAVGGASIPAIIDTGADFSTITETQAGRMGLRLLDTAVSVGSSSKSDVKSKLGVAETLSIGGADFSNVVFIVLPDADLSFANGAYTIDAILGMPVFLEMGRIGVEKKDGKEWFVFGRTPGEAAAQPAGNILFTGETPMLQASVQLDGKQVPISMLLDSGAQTTTMNARFATEFASLLDGAKAVDTKRGGAGGTVAGKAQRLPSLGFTIGDATVTLKNVDVEDETQDDRHGRIGQDALGSAFTIDFDAGRLEVT